MERRREEEDGRRQDISNAIIGFLTGVDRERAVPTLEIAKKILGKGATCGDVNPILYDLRSRRLIDKVCRVDGSKPAWYCNRKMDEVGGSEESWSEEEVIVYKVERQQMRTDKK